MNKVLVCTVTINFPNCEHSQISERVPYADKEEFAKGTIDRQKGLCGKCYAEQCVKNNVTPWYLK